MALTEWTRSMEWLAAASEDPRACKEEWQNGNTGVTLLPAGRFWDVLIVPEELGLRVAGLLDELPLLNPGPSLLDARRHRVGFFLPPEPEAVWIGTGMRRLGKGTWIAAPAPHCRWGALRWLRPPDGTGTLTVPEVMEVALQRCTTELYAPLGNDSSPYMRRPPVDSAPWTPDLCPPTTRLGRLRSTPSTRLGWTRG